MISLHRSLAVVGILLFAVMARSQNAGANSVMHDLNGRACATCHVERTPNAPPSPAAQGSTCDTTQFWDCELPSRTFSTYDAPVPSANVAGAASPGDATQVRLSSMLCASCHDGVFTQTMNATAGFKAGGASSARGLRIDHPIDIPHDPVKNPSLTALPLVVKQVKLFGHTNNVQCTTCHEVHESPNPHLLRLSDKNSTLCVACHL